MGQPEEERAASPASSHSSGRTIARNSAFLGLAFGVTKFFSIALTAIAARVLGTFGFGLYVTGASLVEVGRIVASAGLEYLVTREVASDASRANRVASHASALKLITGAFTYVLLIGAVLVFDYPPEVLAVVLVLGTALFFENLSDVLDAVFQGVERMHVTTRAFAVSAVFLFVSGAAALYGGLGLIGYSVCFALSFVLRFVVMVVAGRRTGTVTLSFTGLDGQELRRMARAGVPLLGATVLALVFHRMDLLMLGKMSTPEQVGLYGAAVRIVDVVVLLPRVLATAVYPALRKRLEDDERAAVALVTESTRISLVACSVAALAVWVFAPVAIRVVGGAAFDPAVFPLRILAWGIVLQGGVHVMARLLLALEAERDFAVVAGLSLMCNLVLNALLIPRYGIDGAAWATLAAYALNLLLYFIASARRGYRVSVIHSMLGPVGAIVAAAGVSVFAATRLDPVTLAFAMFGAWFVVVVALRGVHLADAARLRDWIVRRRVDPV